MAICVYATVIEALVAQALRAADVRDPDLPEQFLSAERALRELGRVRAVTLSAGERTNRHRHPPLGAAVPDPRRPRIS